MTTSRLSEGYTPHMSELAKKHEWKHRPKIPVTARLMALVVQVTEIVRRKAKQSDLTQDDIVGLIIEDVLGSGFDVRKLAIRLKKSPYNKIGKLTEKLPAPMNDESIIFFYGLSRAMKTAQKKVAPMQAASILLEATLDHTDPQRIADKVQVN